MAADEAAQQSHWMVRLRQREEVAEGTMAFHFEKPSGWSFKPGQSLDMTLIDPPETDSEGNTRAFSIASAPAEEMLMTATRLRDTAFKRTLRMMPLGTAVKIEGPFGNMTLHNNASKAAVILAGGIGITPFRSMCVRAAKEKLPQRMFLFYSNRRPEDAPFLDELLRLESENPNYKCIPTMVEMERSSRKWQGESGFITKQMLDKYVKPGTPAVYYIAGPPGLVKGMHEMLNQAGVDDDDIRSEEFSGY